MAYNEVLDWGAFIAAVGTIPWDNKHPWRMAFYAIFLMIVSQMQQAMEEPISDTVYANLGERQRSMLKEMERQVARQSTKTVTAAGIAGIHLARGTTLGYWAGGIPVANMGINTVSGEWARGIGTTPALGFAFLMAKLGVL